MRIIKNKKDILAKTYIEYEKYVRSLDLNNIDNDEVIKNTIKIFYNIDDEQYKKLSYQEVINLNKIIENILKKPSKLVTKFKYNKKTYGIIPNLDDITMLEFVDLNVDDVLQQICILYRPIKHKLFNKYTIEKYSEPFDELKEIITLDIYLGFIGFFLKINKDLMNYTLNYMVEDQDLNQEQKKSLQQNGGGLFGWINSFMVI